MKDHKHFNRALRCVNLCLVFYLLGAISHPLSAQVGISGFNRFQPTYYIYEPPDIDNKLTSHERIAVLPIEVVLPELKSKRKQLTEEEQIELIEHCEILYQDFIHQHLYNRIEKGKLLGITIQDIEATNYLLEEGGVTDMRTLVSSTKTDIADLLEVDAVLGGKVYRGYSRGKGNATEVQIPGKGIAHDGVDIVIELFDGENGEKIWDATGYSGVSSPNRFDDAVSDFAKKTLKYLPYKKKKSE